MRFIINVFLLLVSIQTLGQDFDFVQGRVTDTENNEIANVSIYDSKGKGIISDKNGNFIFKTFTDSLTFSAVGFKARKIAFLDLHKNPLIKLETQIFELNGILITNKKTIWLGYANEKQTVISFALKSSGVSENGIRILRPTHITGFLKTVKVKVGFNGKPKLPLRVNIYNLNEFGLPADNILKKDIVFTPTSKKVKWYKFSVEDQHIELPENGVCIA